MSGRKVERLCAIDCINRVVYDAKVYGGDVVKVIDAESGTIGVRFGPTGNELPLKVETTARGGEQTELVAGYIRRIRS